MMLRHKLLEAVLADFLKPQHHAAECLAMQSLPAASCRLHSCQGIQFAQKSSEMQVGLPGTSRALG